MEPPAFGPWPARFTFSMEIELVRTGKEKGEPDAGFPQLPLRRTASLAPGPHRHLAAEKPQECCFQAGRGGIAPWLWRLGEMPASVVPEQATGASPTDPARMACTPLACLASPIQLPRLPRERPPQPREPGNQQGWPLTCQGCCVEYQQAPVVSLRASLLLLHTQY